MRKIWKSLLAAGAVAGVGVATAVTTAGASSTPPREPVVEGAGHITVRASGSVTVEPDIATIRLGVTASEPTGDAAMERVTAGSNALTEAISESGIDAEDVTTAGIRLQPRYDRDGNQVTGFEAAVVVVVTVRDLDTIGTTIDTARQAAGEGFTIEGVSFSHSDPEAVLGDARAAAARQARTKAEQYAEPLGVSIAGVIAVTEDDAQEPLRYDVPMAAAAEADAALAVSPGTLELTVQISVTFAIG